MSKARMDIDNDRVAERWPSRILLPDWCYLNLSLFSWDRVL